MSQAAATKQQLQDAFELFNQLSEQLTGSYQSLQQQVVSLNQQLSAARTQRLRLIDEIHGLQQEASRSRRLSSMGEMTARLAHQVRTPLSTALLYASQLKHNTLPRQQHDCFVDRLLVGLRHLDHMVNDMLVFARGGQAGHDIIRLTELLENIRETLLPRLNACGAHWQVECKDASIDVEGQREVLVSVFANLAVNALDACCGETARLVWHILATEAVVTISLQDNGTGIDRQLQDKIFEPFFTTRSNGTGLGLAVVRAVIHAHQGSIELDSAYQDGARFIIELPRRKPEQYLPSQMVKNQKKVLSTASRYR
jgi:two-component system sensor histidine kinase FlrB